MGIVPTMGALHAGHRSLVERAAAECDAVIVTVFVNPTQFGENSDLINYPRTFEADLDVAAAAGASFVFAPSVDEMYPDGLQTVPVPPAAAAVARSLEGASRPGHFDGVATVVPRLLTPAGACRAYFGEKDFQQLALVRRLVTELGLPVEVVGCETVQRPRRARPVQPERAPVGRRAGRCPRPRARTPYRSRGGEGERRER